MNAKRILPWEDDGNESYAGTDIGEYQIYFDFEFGWGATFDNDCSLDFPNGENSLDVAKSVCEADYVARCTEFLRLAGPGEVVVKVEDAKLCQDQIRCRQSDLLVEQPVSEMVWAELEFTTGLLNRLTAAIDAASKE